MADVALNINTISPAGGELKWDDPLTTVVVQETEYAWTYTPIDDKNYEKLKGSLTP